MLTFYCSCRRQHKTIFANLIRVGVLKHESFFKILRHSSFGCPKAMTACAFAPIIYTSEMVVLRIAY